MHPAEYHYWKAVTQMIDAATTHVHDVSQLLVLYPSLKAYLIVVGALVAIGVAGLCTTLIDDAMRSQPVPATPLPFDDGSRRSMPPLASRSAPSGGVGADDAVDVV